MHMSFWFGPDLGDFMIKGLQIKNATALTILCVIVVFFSIIYESIKVHDAKVRARAARERQRTQSCAPSETANLLTTDTIAKPPLSKRIIKGLTEASIFLMHNALGYALMLTVMMYNGYLFIAVIIGMGLGYFIFGHISMKINMENVQAKTNNVICSPQCEAGKLFALTNNPNLRFLRSSTSVNGSMSSQGPSYTINTSPSAAAQDTSPIREASKL